MGSPLSTEQVLLLNNLMYMTNDAPLQEINGSKDCWSVGDIIGNIRANVAGGHAFQADREYGSLMTGQDWENIVNAIEADPELMNVRIVQTHREEDGGGVSALFVNPAANEAVVVYRGTAPGEWKDNFLGGGSTGAADGVSTPYQEGALEWYQGLELSSYDSVTVSGHSKGGNKAKYITLRDDSVDRCLAFDGQGFSDEFMEEYRDEISLRQDKIENHNVDSDYVNLLLNDVGNSRFYQGQDIGRGGILENHCPNTFLRFGEEGSVSMVLGERSPAMETLDEFLNSYLRTATSEEKADKLNIIGSLADIACNSTHKQEDIIHYLLLPDTLQEGAELLAWTSRYIQDNPELADRLKEALEQFGMGDAADFVGMAEDIFNSKYFDAVSGILGNAANGGALLTGLLPEWAVNGLLDMVEDTLGVRLRREELVRLLGFVARFVEEREKIDSAPNRGGDIRIGGAVCKSVYFSCKPDSLRRAGEELSCCAGRCDGSRAQVIQIWKQLEGAISKTVPGLAFSVRNLERQVLLLHEFAAAAGHIAEQYQKTEKRICQEGISLSGTVLS